MPDLTWSINAQVARGNLNQAFVASGVTADSSASGITTLTLTPGTNAAGTAALVPRGGCSFVAKALHLQAAMSCHS